MRPKGLFANFPKRFREAANSEHDFKIVPNSVDRNLNHLNQTNSERSTFATCELGLATTVYVNGAISHWHTESGIGRLGWRVVRFKSVR